MKSHPAISLLALLSLCTFARAADRSLKVTPKGRVLEYGLFELVGAEQREANAKTLDGEQQISEGARFYEQTNRVPAMPGVRFGFRFSITGVTEQDTAEFKKVVTHPPIKNEKGEVERSYSTTETLPTRNGYVSEVSGYSLDRFEELVPGFWTFELWYHGQKMVSQAFTVYTPPKSARRFISIEDRLMVRAKKIPIPRVEWKDTTFADALEFLRTEARAHDPKRQGIPIEMHVDPWPMEEYFPNSKKAKPAPPGGWPLYEPLKQRITLSLRNTSLAEAIRYAVALAGLRVVPSRTALMISPPIWSVEPLLTHTIPLAAAPKAEIEKMHANPKQYFADCGVHFFRDGADCSFEDNGATLVITNTLDQLDLVDTLLEGLVRDKPWKESK